MAGLWIFLRLKFLGHGEPKSQRLDWVQNPIHDAVLANSGRGYLDRKAEVEEAIRLNQRTIGIGDLVGLGIEKV